MRKQNINFCWERKFLENVSRPDTEWDGERKKGHHTALHFKCLATLHSTELPPHSLDTQELILKWQCLTPHWKDSWQAGESQQSRLRTPSHFHQTVAFSWIGRGGDEMWNPERVRCNNLRWRFAGTTLVSMEWATMWPVKVGWGTWLGVTHHVACHATPWSLVPPASCVTGGHWGWWWWWSQWDAMTIENFNDFGDDCNCQ